MWWAFIQGAMSIPDSRVLLPTQGDWTNEVQPPRLGDYTNISYLKLLENFVKNVSLCIALCCIVTLLTQKELARRPSSLLLIHQSTSCHISLCLHGVCPNIYSHLLSHFLEGRKFQEFVQLNSQTLAYTYQLSWLLNLKKLLGTTMIFFWLHISNWNWSWHFLMFSIQDYWC